MRRELAAVRAERVGLDQVGAGVDEADVEGDDRFGSAEIGLFRAAETRNRARDEHAHAAVGDDDRPRVEALCEAVRHGLNSMAGRGATAGPPERLVKWLSQLPSGDGSSRGCRRIVGLQAIGPMRRGQIAKNRGLDAASPCGAP